ncbi:hypothetical protein NDU88_009532, partial [Pleurodeles waltl]
MFTGPQSGFPGGTSKGETSLRTCVTLEAEGDAGQRKQEEKTPKKTSGVLDTNRIQRRSRPIPRTRETLNRRRCRGSTK